MAFSMMVPVPVLGWRERLPSVHPIRVNGRSALDLRVSEKARLDVTKRARGA
ncbi:hypothetical protein QMK17_08995 [Rhodococcus sp. G-MC3]|uniref:hypothetical protein n=1 Tax=Rhodococcus sp. G-MC3 TaxID=3046209 RepID=UPI0024BBA345|nr:hypothetical protein [Rhodococcus sp. G-MC3]MDJ0393469.1 hypothetical protein [Rhodococcus sp. G-MC3]